MEVIVLASSLFISWGGVIALGVLFMALVAGVTLAIIFGAISIGKRTGRQQPTAPPRGPVPPKAGAPAADGAVRRNYCPYCGIRLYEDACFCANCGRDVKGISGS